ncbi:hypothetical protein O1L55_09640 [Streptomyces albulus]|nr:hypothetical protein [Streptomyces noursei]
MRPRRDAAAPHGTLVFPLSARTAEALAETADRLARFLHAGAVALPDVAHTSRSAARRSRSGWRSSPTTAPHSSPRWRPPPGTPPTPPPSAVGYRPGGPPPRRTGALGLAPVELARRWAVGADVDWRAHAPGGAPAARRIALPTYPSPAPATGWPWPGRAGAPRRPDRRTRAPPGPAGPQRLHLPRHRLRQDPDRHRVLPARPRRGGHPVLPGVAYLDMARLAGELAHGAPADGPARPASRTSSGPPRSPSTTGPGASACG